MKLSLVLLVSALVYAIFAVGALLVPGALASLYGLNLTGSQVLPVRVAGAGLAGFAVLAWLVQNQSENPTLRAVKMALFVWNVLGALVFLLAVLQGEITAFGWVSVVLYGLLAIGVGRFTFM